MRLAPEEESAKLTGYEHNAVTCVGLKTEIPVVIFLLSFYLSSSFCYVFELLKVPRTGNEQITVQLILFVNFSISTPSYFFDLIVAN